MILKHFDTGFYKSIRTFLPQKSAGHALHGHYQKEIIIIGVLIQKETFLPVLSANSKLLYFFLDPQINLISDEFIHLKFDDIFPVNSLIVMMVMEYTKHQENTQYILKPLVLALFMQITRQYHKSNIKKVTTLSEK